VDQTALSSGLVLSARYRLEDLISESFGTSTWRASDETLHRSVCIQALPEDDRRAEAFFSAARQSTTVSDPRFLRVLDAVQSQDGVTYLVREWARASSLDLLLRESTLPNGRAATVVAELAEAIGNAHEAGVHHRHLHPGCVLLKDSGAVRITGLAVDHALLAPVEEYDSSGADAGYAEQLDVQAIGKVLYACLTGRWPGSSVGHLRQAPTQHRRLMRSRQVRAGVSRDVDTVCDQILGTPPRNHAPALRSARDIAHQLRLVGDDDAPQHDDQPSLVGVCSPDLFRNDPVVLPLGPPPAVNPPRRKPAALAPAPPSAFEVNKARARRATQGDRALIWTGIIVGVALAVSLAFIIGRTTTGAGTSEAASNTAGAPPRDVSVRPLAVKEIASFDPKGDGEESPAEVANAVDGDRGTSWSTLEYYNRPDLGGLKPGVGLLLDLGRVRLVSSVAVAFGASPTSFEILISEPGVTSAPASLSGLRDAVSIDAAPAQASARLQRPARTRFVLLWVTELPPNAAANYEGIIEEIVVRGTP